MLPKYKYPFLNRKQRRHPKREAQAITKGWMGGGHWLLASLLARGSYNAAPPVLDRNDPQYGAVV